MIDVLIGDIFESKAQTLVNTVNCVGIMGKGLALEFKKHFPVMYEDYVVRCKAKGVRLGEPYLYSELPSPWILNFPTKGHWRSASRLSDIVSGLEYLEEHYHKWKITSLAVPALGCQNGLLEWHSVGPLLYQHLSQLDIPVELYAPYGTPQEETEIAFLSQSPVRSQKINPAHIGLVEIMVCIEREPYHWPIGRTIFQKIAYFATGLGLPTGLHFVRDSYGPFSSQVSPLLAQLVNSSLIQETPLGKMLALKPGPQYADVAQTFQAELAQWESIINRVTDLFLRMDTQQAEIAATIHFTTQALQRETGFVTERAIFEEAKHWKQRRRPPLQDEDIAQAVRDLNLLGWIQAQPSPELPFAEKDEELLPLDV